MTDLMWAAVPFIALALAIAWATDYEREQRRRFAARGKYAAALARMAANFDEVARQIGAALLPAIERFNVAMRDFETAFETEPPTLHYPPRRDGKFPCCGQRATDDDKWTVFGPRVTCGGDEDRSDIERDEAVL